ncbi:MAG: hypothetical protein CVV41_21145 [Candidatus Riflebacteria bacterium HGW-Riflebacteria-1]|jgi:hypothetical protein|nr:MAG: hypothetical protein CVV41_21145 [Candidatus Riflebacteria bacterium HGW-Riflebacteria-1]
MHQHEATADKISPSHITHKKMDSLRNYNFSNSSKSGVLKSFCKINATMMSGACNKHSFLKTEKNAPKQMS